MRILRLAVLSLFVSLTACLEGGSAITFPVATVSSGPGANAAIAGAWTRTIVFVDDAGFAQSSQTLWSFNADGTGTLTVIATNLTAGVSDTTITNITWSTSGTSLQVTLLAPSSGSISLSFTLTGDTLTLGGQPFVRRA